jgi:hypothetical protein
LRLLNAEYRLNHLHNFAPKPVCLVPLKRYTTGEYLSIKISDRSNHRWESANTLCGHVATGDFKTDIFPLLFFKRISDVDDEEYAEASQKCRGSSRFQHAMDLGKLWSAKPEPPPCSATPLAERAALSRQQRPPIHIPVGIGRPTSVEVGQPVDAYRVSQEAVLDFM